VNCVDDRSLANAGEAPGYEPEGTMTAVNVVGERYTLTSELGRGGMATVHRAHDARHGRDVAVKVMLPEIAESVGAERFLREIAIVARLQHPHIVPVFDSGQVDGALFFVMPLIEGESLRARLDRERHLGIDEAVRIVREIADALEYAHAEGVVHRDLKPENILLSRGHALLADFGIARAAGADRDASLTQDGSSLGTPAYMSPEQAAGDRDIGPASDVYALGCILFELLVGAPPFTGPTYQAILVRRFTENAPLVRSRRPDVPEAIEAAIATALERDPERRLPSARAFADALEGASPVPTPRGATVGDRSIVVLPFDSLSPDANDAYLADGLTEELIADLSKVSALRVIGRSSSMAARQQTRDLKEIARMLDVRYLLEGSVRRAGPQLRITAQLIDGTTDAHVWAEKYGGTMDDVFEMQERISRAIVGELRARLTTSEERRGRVVTDPETYELYLRARYMLGQSLHRLPEASALLDEVTRRDPNFVPAYCALGAPLVFCAFLGVIPPAPALARIQELADRALAVDPRSGPATELLAAARTYRDWNWAEARRLYQRASELEPGTGFDGFLHAWFLAFSGDVAAALRESQAQRKLDPLSFFGHVTEGAMHLYSGAPNEALRLVEMPIALDPQFPESYHIKGYIQLFEHDFAGALSTLERAVELGHRSAWPVAKMGCALAGLGHVTEAEALLEELERRASSEFIASPAVATLHLHLGDHDSFYRWMDRALDERDPFAVSINRERLWDRARGEPRFQQMARRMGLASG
jgi:serine/threonine-protein kinase